MDASSAPPTYTGKRVLVVEDMAIVAHEIEFILKKMQCDVVGPVAELDDAMQMVREAAMDGVILDVDLHGTESYPIADELQARGIPFIFTTGYGVGSMPQKYHSHPRLEKPFGMKDLATKLAQMFAGEG
jgi:CheY-like chemotaxis protein